MPHSVYATFPNERDAERAAGALIDHGVPSEAISFIVPADFEPDGTHRMRFAPDDINGPASSPTNTGAPMPADIPAPDPTNLGHSHSPGLQGHRLGGMEDTSSGMGRALYSSRDTMIQEEELDRHAGTMTGTMLAIDGDVAEHERRANFDNKHHESPRAASGLSATSAADAERGALAGIGIGASLGVALGLAAIAIPGIGFVAGTGALVAMLTGATAAAGGIAGGVLGYLEDMGMSSHTAHTIARHMEQGQPMLTIHSQFNGEPVDIAGILAKYGATVVETL